MKGKAAKARKPVTARNTTFPFAPGAAIVPCWIAERVIQQRGRVQLQYRVLVPMRDQLCMLNCKY
jgi:hypothetical protein